MKLRSDRLSSNIQNKQKKLGSSKEYGGQQNGNAQGLGGKITEKAVLITPVTGLK